ncbi:hypothetical protein WJX81_004321 [Elliptochloris bilobata]|uniref:Sugar phosphate transporter domain-containing protein n=1 Tax=Elliptochloris bilobata TaxID=381761 RepID=A0AAW1SIZ5_9CHLO
MGALGAVIGLKAYSKGTNARSARILYIVGLIVSYSLCSSMLLILNKVAVTFVPAPSFILFGQLATSAAFVQVLAAARQVECERLQWIKIQKFALIVFGFIGTLYSNVTSLKYVPVDTIICFRASIPLVIAVIEFAYMGRELPSPRSWAALFGVLGGVVVYTYHDIHFTVLGYMWIAIWYSFAVFEMVYVKIVVDSVQMTTWSRTYYQNVLAMLPMAAVALCAGEVATLRGLEWTPAGVAVVAASCVAGLGMSYFSFALRAAISATSFSVIGNVCKVLTILVNLLMWDQHANAWGTAGLLACLAAGSFYQQPPMRARSGKADKDPPAGNAASDLANPLLSKSPV